MIVARFFESAKTALLVIAGVIVAVALAFWRGISKGKTEAREDIHRDSYKAEREFDESVRDAVRRADQLDAGRVHDKYNRDTRKP